MHQTVRAHTIREYSWRDRLRRVLWLPFSLLWSGAVLVGMAALEFVFLHRQQLRRHQGVLWLLLSCAYSLLALVFLGKLRWQKPPDKNDLHFVAE